MKKLAMVFRVALNSLTVHVMRTMLTMLGIVIGVAAVISLVAVGKGAQAQVLSQFQALGSNLVTVSAMQNFGFSQSGLQTSSTDLTMADVKAIEALASSVSLVAPVYSSTATVTYGGNTIFDQHQRRDRGVQHRAQRPGYAGALHLDRGQ